MIRPATIHDIEALLKMGKTMFNESWYRKYDFDSEKVRFLIHALIASDEGIALVAENDGEIIGGFLGECAEHYFGNHRYAYDFAIFVKPEHRGGLTGATLLQAYIATAERMGVDEITIANTTGVMPERVEKLFTRIGFERLGGVFKMQVGK